MNNQTKPPHGWTCFHCGETFTTVGAAGDHFGNFQYTEPACRIKNGNEKGLLMAFRKMEDELRILRDVLIAKNARLTEQMNDLRSAFYVNMLRCYPTKTHQEISDAIEAATTGRVAAKPGHLTEHHDSASM